MGIIKEAVKTKNTGIARYGFTFLKLVPVLLIILRRILELKKNSPMIMAKIKYIGAALIDAQASRGVLRYCKDDPSILNPHALKSSKSIPTNIEIKPTVK
tara:strand:+ start:42 stop:341 length:300 start_codon:yes stop_codon:yes gene_type:complete